MRIRAMVFAATAVSLLLAACGRDDGDEATDEASSGDAAQDESQDEEAAGAVEGAIDVWAMGAEGENLDVLAEDFMAENPDVTVTVTPVPWDAAHDRIVNAIAGGEVPDVSLIGTTWMGEFGSMGGLDPTPDSIEPAQFFEGAWDTTVVDGVSYGVPWYVETRLLYYRTDLAEDAGIDTPPANWDELEQLAEGMEESGAEYGIGLQPSGTGAWQTFMPFFWQAGGDIVDESGAFTLDSQACEDALSYYDSFNEEGLSPAGEFPEIVIEDAFADGRLGSFISGPWMIGIITDAGADQETWNVAQQPAEQAGTSFVGGGNLAVFGDSDNKAAAWAFVEYASRPEVQVKWYETVSALPAVQSAWDDPALANDELLSAFGEQLEDAKSPPAIPTWEQVAAIIDGQIEQVTLGDATAADACSAMQQEAEAIGTGL